MSTSDATAYNKAKEFALSDAEFDHLRRLVHVKTGISLSQAKRELVYGRLVRRVRALRLDTFADYIAMVEDGHPEEMQEFINAITTNLTSFYRESHHFEFLAGTVIPELVKANAATRRIRIWCSACSTGEEPYTIAMALRETESLWAGYDVKVLATDLDTNCVTHARRGVYAAERVRDLPRATQTRWFHDAADGRSVRVKPELQGLVTFGQLNLMDPWPIKGPLDVIFCRNVVIYFDKESQRRLFDRMADLQREDATLFLGHSETLFKVTTRYELVGRTVYRRKGP
jgi:chemotaxis protein methyltransferase CheR